MRAELMMSRGLVLEALKESKDWQIFVQEVEKVVIREVKEHKGAAWWAVLIEVAIAAGTECADELMEAIKNSEGIPAEWKAADKSEWFRFAMAVVLEQVTIISDALQPAPVAAPEVPV